MNTSVNVTLHSVGELTVDVRRSSIPEQGLCTRIAVTDNDGIPSVTLYGYGGYGVTPAAVADRLRQLADEIDAEIGLIVEAAS